MNSWCNTIQVPQSAALFLTREVASKQLACAGFPEAKLKHTHTHTHMKTKTMNNNQHSICPQELLIQTRWATIAFNNSNLLCYSSPITEHCLKYQFEIVNQPRSKNVYPWRLIQISHHTNSSRHTVPSIHLACCDTHNFFSSSLVENGLPLFLPHSKPWVIFLI